MALARRPIGLLVFAALVLVFVGWILRAGPVQETAASRAYVGHENDADMRGFIRQYPAAAGTRLDDCQTCHRGGIKGLDTEREYSPCSYCHLLVYPNARYASGVPKSMADTLNAYGLAYRNAGRRFEAFAAIDGKDSDGDGHRNGVEIADLRNPGDPASRPGLPQAAMVTLGWEEIRGLPVHSQFMLMNTTKEPTDDYVLFKGVRVIDVLSAAKVTLTGVTGITVFAPDGYSIDYSLEDIQAPFPHGIFMPSPARSRARKERSSNIPPTCRRESRTGRRSPRSLGSCWPMNGTGRRSTLRPMKRALAGSPWRAPID